MSEKELHESPFDPLDEKLQVKILERTEEFSKALKARTASHFRELGEFIHCHLLIEKYIAEHIKTFNPRIGPIEKVLRSFGAKLSLAEVIEDSWIGATGCLG